MNTSDQIIVGNSTRTILGLKPNLWRLALIVGLAQTSMSLWTWQYSIFLENIIQPWQMGITFSTSTVASLAGYMSSGIISDHLGRKRTLMISFIPMIIGLLLFATFPIWPFIPFEVAMVQFGWAFVIIIARTFPADIIAAEKAKDPARKFMMVLLPAFAMDGLSPIIGANLFILGFKPTDLYLIAAFMALVSIIVSYRFIRESMSAEILEKAKIGPKISFRNLGTNFWKLVAGMIGFVFFFNTALPYWGNLVVGEWGIDVIAFGYVYSTFSLSSAIMMYASNILADRNLKIALFGAILGNVIVISLLGASFGFIALVALTIGWSIPVAIWIGAERSLIVADVDDAMKGRAMGTYQFMMTSTSVIASPFGAFLWDITGSLRTVYLFCGIEGLACLGALYLALNSMKSTQSKDDEDNTTDEDDLSDS